jgi:phospholipid/cholesterol/gamma-HCH transport system permease protein
MASRTLTRLFGATGRGALTACEQAGGVTVLFGRVLGALAPPSFDGRAFLRGLYRMGNLSVPIIALTAFFTGGIMVIQAGVFVRRFDASGLLGWGTGYATLREVGPILIGLMFSGRVGANNTAELATMTVTEQIDGLRALAIDPVRFLVVPRVLAMIIALVALTVMGNLIALFGAALFSDLLLGIDYSTFYYSFADHLGVDDLLHGLVKAAAFGLAIAVTSCYFGLSARGGAVGVGRAVNAAVVSAAVAIVILDLLVTFSLR